MAQKTLSSTITLAELLKRVPKNQLEQFEQFSKKSLEYQREMNKYPDKLPAIDWEFYRNNVQKSSVSLVNSFEIQYKELDQVFGTRHTTLNFSKYYKELNNLLKEAEEDIKEFIGASNERIAILEEEVKRLCDLPPFTDMTMEEFVTLCPEISQNVPCQGRPIFWPPFDEIGQREVKVAKKEDQSEKDDKAKGNKDKAEDQTEAKDNKPKDDKTKNKKDK